MRTHKRKLLIIVAVILVTACVLIFYSASQKPSVISKPGRYCSEKEGLSMVSSSVFSGDIILDMEGRCFADLSSTQVKHYTVKHSLIHGDIVVVDWLKNKKLKFKVVSDTNLIVLEDCGFFEKGQTYILREEI